MKDEELLRRLLPMFRIEAQDHLRVISSGLIEIEKSDPGRRAEIVETIYRESHSLKGAARSVNASQMVSICQSMENVFSALKKKEITPTPGILDLLHRAVDFASRLVAIEEVTHLPDAVPVGELLRSLETAAKMQESEGISPGTISAEEDREQIKGAPPIQQTPSVAAATSNIPGHPAAPSSIDTVRISAATLDSLLLKAEEMLSVKIAINQLTDDLRELHKELAQWERERGRKMPVDPGLRQGRSTEGRRDSDPFITSFETRLENLVKSTEYDQRSLGAMVDALLVDTKKTLMLPFSSLLEIFPKLVRDLSREAGKEVDLTISGGDIEMDRRVLEEIKGPLIHILRNCIDHGIESPGERENKGKPPRGKISVTGSSFDSKIEIKVSDDGHGIDPATVRDAAERCGAISREEAERLDEKGSLSLVFRSGVTTSPLITDISGRGLGLAIVMEHIEKLNGTVALDTQLNAGTTIRMVAPLTIATFRGVLVRVGEHLFFLPSANIEKVTRVRVEEIQTVENRATLSLDGRTISLVHLDSVLGLRTTPAGFEPDQYAQVVVLVSTGQRVAFQVDEIIHEQEVLQKNLGPQLSRVRNIAGATLLGKGKVVPILNVPDLMASAFRAAPVQAGPAADELSKRYSILVVEDSITSRVFLRTILESAGFDVTTAVDGVDALTALKTGQFDLVVSDIEMPRMNGFDLTERIRSDKRLSHTPVVLVTALESREDKERGIDVGANAYIVKSRFEQSNLLEVIRRLL